MTLKYCTDSLCIVVPMFSKLLRNIKPYQFRMYCLNFRTLKICILTT